MPEISALSKLADYIEDRDGVFIGQLAQVIAGIQRNQPRPWVLAGPQGMGKDHLLCWLFGFDGHDPNRPDWMQLITTTGVEYSQAYPTWLCRLVKIDWSYTELDPRLIFPGGEL